MENNEMKNELITSDDNSIKGQLISSGDQFCSMTANTPEQKKILFKAMNSPDHKLADFINKKIRIKDMYCEIVTIADQNTGEIVKLPRIVLIDEKGVGYQCVSNGIFMGLKKLVAIFGEPTWKQPIEIEIKNVKTRNGYTALTFDLC